MRRPFRALHVSRSTTYRDDAAEYIWRQFGGVKRTRGCLPAASFGAGYRGGQPTGRREGHVQQVAQTSERFVQQDAALIAESQKLRYYPLVARSASGCTITDVDGKEYLDLTAGWCVANTGYGHPAVARAIEDAYSELSFACAASLIHPRAVALAERLAASVPGPGPKKVWFGNSGSDANDGVAEAGSRWPANGRA